MTVVVIPGLLVFALLAIPYLRYENEQTGPWFLSPTGRRRYDSSSGRLSSMLRGSSFGRTAFRNTNWQLQ